MASGSEADNKTAESSYRRRLRLVGRGSERNDLSGSNLRDESREPDSEFDLHGGEEGLGQEEASDKPQVGKRTPPHGALQNVDDERCQGSDHREVFHGENRSEGVFLADAGGEKTPKVPFFSLEGKKLQFPVSPIRSERRSADHYESVQAGDRPLAEVGSHGDNLYRRFASSRGVKRGLLDSRANRAGHTFELRRGSKRQKVIIVSDPDTGISGVRDRLTKYDNYRSRLQDKKLAEGAQQVEQQGSSLTERTSFNSGKNQRTSGRFIPDEDSYDRVTLSKSRYVAQVQGLGQASTLERKSSERANLVEGEHRADERFFPNTSSTGYDSRNGRLRHRLGGVDRRDGQSQPDIEDQVRGDFFSGRKPNAYQLQRDACGKIFIVKLSERSEREVARHWNRQYHNSLSMCRN